MLQLVTIFEKIKEDFFENQIDETKNQYKIVFAPFSTGFSNEDFLFLDSNTASQNALKFHDKLYEFSQIANTIPVSDNFWAIPKNIDDYLFDKYEKILKFLKYVEQDSLEASMCYGHSVLDNALSKIDSSIKRDYEIYYKQYLEKTNEIQFIKNSMDLLEFNQDFYLEDIIEDWETKGNRTATEKEIKKIIISEIKRFVKDHSDIKSRIESTKRTHIGSESQFNITYCMPNNLYQSDELEWKKIIIGKEELVKISKSEKVREYEAILGDSGFSKFDINSISFELIFVNVTRSWFEESLLSSPFWDIDILDKTEIHIPCYTDKLIFVRQLDTVLNNNLRQDKRVTKKVDPTVDESSLTPEDLIRSTMSGYYNPNLIKYEFDFNDNNNQIVNVLPEEINIFKDYQKKDLKIEKTTTGSILFLLQKDDIFIVVIEKSGFEGEEIIIDTHGLEGHIKKTLLLTLIKEVEVEKKAGIRIEKEIDNTFRLIGVVAKKVTNFPNPIKKADYL